MVNDREPSYLAEHIREALATDERVAEPELKVKVVANRAIVRGVVPSDARRDQVTLVIEDLFPELDVDNQVSILSAGPPA